MAGADMSYLQDMCSKLFGAIEEDELVPGQFDSPPTKKLCAEEEKEETKVGETTGVISKVVEPFKTLVVKARTKITFTARCLHCSTLTMDSKDGTLPPGLVVTGAYTVLK